MITLFSPFDVRQDNAGTPIKIQLTSSNGTTALFTKSSGSFFANVSNIDPTTSNISSVTIEDVQYDSLLGELVRYMYDNGFGTWTYGYDLSANVVGTNKKFYLSSSNPTVSGALIKFDSFSAKVLGFQNGTTASQAVYTSSIAPMYTWNSTEAEWVKQSFVYEGNTKAKLVRESQCDDGRVTAISNEGSSVSWLSNTTTNHMFADWSFEYEPRSNMLNDYSSSNAPNTFESFYKTVKSYRPFVVFETPQANTSNAVNSSWASVMNVQQALVSGNNYENRVGTYKLRAENTKFAIKRTMGSYDDAWSIDLKTRRLSSGSNFHTPTSVVVIPTGSVDIGFMYTFSFDF